MHIDTVNITVHQAAPSMATALVAALMQATDMGEEHEANGVTPAPASTVSPAPNVLAIGEYWMAQGGIYAGIARGRDGAPDYHLILAEEAPTKGFNWQGALDHAKTIAANGHSDFRVPTRFESALLYANLQDKLDTGNYHWTSTHPDELYAWIQHFDDGGQYYGSKGYERRCRFVRSSVL